MAFLVLPVLTETVLERIGLLLRGEPRNQVGMAGGDALLLERLGNVRYELQKRKPRLDVALALAALGRKRRHVVAGKV